MNLESPVRARRLDVVEPERVGIGGRRGRRGRVGQRRGRRRRVDAHLGGAGGRADHGRGGLVGLVAGLLVGAGRQTVGLLGRDPVGGRRHRPLARLAVRAVRGAVEAGDGHGAVAGRGRLAVLGLEAAHGDELALLRPGGDLAVGAVVGPADVVDHPLEAGGGLLVLEGQRQGGAVGREVGGVAGAGHGRDLHHLGGRVDLGLLGRGRGGAGVVAGGEEQGEEEHGNLRRREL